MVCSAGADTHIWNAGTPPDTSWHSNSWISLEASSTVYCQERGLTLSGINNNSYLLLSLLSTNLKAGVSHILLFYFFLIRPLSSSCVWQTATLGQVSGRPLAESPLLLVSSSAKLVVFFKLLLLPRSWWKKWRRAATTPWTFHLLSFITAFRDRPSPALIKGHIFLTEEGIYEKILQTG